MCECNGCKHSRGELTDKQYRRRLRKEIKELEKIKRDVETNLGSAYALLHCLEFDMKKKKKEESK